MTVKLYETETPAEGALPTYGSYITLGASTFHAKLS